MKRLLLRNLRILHSITWTKNSTISSAHSSSQRIFSARGIETAHCSFATSTTTPDFSTYYRIEVSNAERADATKLIVRGPDIDGIMASMTLSLAMQGCSLVELHASKSKAIDTAVTHTRFTDDSSIEDVFYVVNRVTGMPFADAALEPLAKALLQSLRTPMTVLSGHGGEDGPEKTWDKLQKSHPEPSYCSEQPQITIIKSKSL